MKTYEELMEQLSALQSELERYDTYAVTVRVTGVRTIRVKARSEFEAKCMVADMDTVDIDLTRSVMCVNVEGGEQ
jgi:hypothetical protein